MLSTISIFQNHRSMQPPVLVDLVAAGGAETQAVLDELSGEIERLNKENASGHGSFLRRRLPSGERKRDHGRILIQSRHSKGTPP